VNNNDIIEHPDFPGLRFRVHIEQDDDHEAPWECEDGHGPVRHVRSRDDKRAGERIMPSHTDGYWLYDWQEASKLAKRDGWGGDDPVQADFDRLRGWLNGDWQYIGVCVALIDEHDRPITDKYEHALWGIESDCDSYLKEVALELAHGCAQAWRVRHGEELAVAEEARQLKADAMRWRKFCRLAKSQALGAQHDEAGHLHYPLYRRWFFDAVDLTAETPSAALDSLKEPTP
jgi:hypothetical protein